MRYKIEGNKIKVFSLDEFNPKHIFECGQVFSYKKIDEAAYIFHPQNQVFFIYKKLDFYIIKHIGGEGTLQNAVELFDLNTNYGEIKNGLI